MDYAHKTSNDLFYHDFDGFKVIFEADREAIQSDMTWLVL